MPWPGLPPRGVIPQEDRQLAQRLLNSRKEQGEHRMVVDFLASHLEGLGLCPQYPKTPSLLRLSNIQHLHTPYSGGGLGGNPSPAHGRSPASHPRQ